LEPIIKPSKVVFPKLTKMQLNSIKNDKEDLFDLQDKCSNSKDSINYLQTQIKVEQTVITRKERQIQDIRHKNKEIKENIKSLEKRLNDIKKDKDADMGKQQKIIQELAESQKKDEEINQTLQQLEETRVRLKKEIEEEEEKTKVEEVTLKKQYEEMNQRNNKLANELQQLRRNLANLNEQLEFSKETEKQLEMDYNNQ